MKRLFLLRHAKAGFGTSDQARPLDSRGKADALWMGKHLKKHNLVPDHILCSSAARTRETLDLVQQSEETGCPAVWRDDFYLASADHMAQKIRDLEQHINAPMIIGHNPGIALLCHTLLHDPAGKGIGINFPTCSMAILEFDIEDWSALESNTGQLFHMIIASERQNNTI